MNFKINKNNINLDQLVDKLQKEDETYANTYRGIQVSYWILFIPYYIYSTISLYVDSGEINELIAGLCYVIAFVIAVIFLGNYHKEYKYVDYSLPILKMLNNAAYRYKLFQLKSIWIIIPILLIETSEIIKSNLNDSFIKDQFVFLGIILFSLVVRIIFWFIKHKPLRDNALRLIAEIEGE